MCHIFHTINSMSLMIVFFTHADKPPKHGNLFGHSNATPLQTASVQPNHFFIWVQIYWHDDFCLLEGVCVYTLLLITSKHKHAAEPWIIDRWATYNWYAQEYFKPHNELAALIEQLGTGS